MNMEPFAFRRSLQMIEVLQLLVASCNPRAAIQGEVFSYKGFAGSVVHDLDEARFYVFDREGLIVYGPDGDGADRSHDPRSDRIMCSLLSEMISEQKLQVGKKMMAMQASR